MKGFTNIKHLNICLSIAIFCLLPGCVKNMPPLPTKLSADQYMTMASTAKPEQKPLYQLAAANKLIESEKADQASQVLSNMAPQITPQEAAEKQLIQAKVELLNGQAQQSLTLLNTITKNNISLTQTQQITLHELLANTYEVLNNINASINQRSILQSLLADPQSQHLNLISIWHSLQSLDPEQLTAMLNSPQSNNMQGWLTLAIITKQSQTPDELIESLKEWESKFPNHAAITLLPKNISQKVTQATLPQHIALLLPLHGRLASTGQAIRNGFLAAYYAAEKHQVSIPTLKIIDTSKGDITQTYQNAIHDGAQFVIGPLTKEHLTTLLNADTLSVPTLALNTLANNTNNNPNLYQFGLSPLDEAAQAATQGQQKNFKSAVVLAPNNTWGQSVATVFTQNWQNAGGTITSQLNYDGSANLAKQISHLLNIDLANQDYTQLRTLLGKRMRFIPRRRQDIDMIYMIGQPIYARQIAPLLKYYYAGDIPTYSTSQIYSGNNHARAIRDLNNVYFCDMPWVLTPDQESPKLKKLRTQIETIWPQSYSNHKKLYALGIDAYTLAAKLEQMKAMPQFAIVGATGDLYLDQAQHIYRKLIWAKFQNGDVNVIK